jgi:L-iditol 2-dehydrogenase
MGHGVDGAFTRYLVVRPDQLYRLPDGMSLEAGALSEPFAAVVQAVTEITRCVWAKRPSCLDRDRLAFCA